MRAWQPAGPALDAMRHDDSRNGDASGIRAVLLTTEMFQRLGLEVAEEPASSSNRPGSPSSAMADLLDAAQAVVGFC